MSDYKTDLEIARGGQVSFLSQKLLQKNFPLMRVT